MGVAGQNQTVFAYTHLNDFIKSYKMSCHLTKLNFFVRIISGPLETLNFDLKSRNLDKISPWPYGYIFSICEEYPAIGLVEDRKYTQTPIHTIAELQTRTWDCW